MFIAGDTHQRIYDHQIALGALGINIRGRAARLTLSYRTTKEILAHALRIVDPVNPNEPIIYDDLDDGTATLAGYRSVLHGCPPDFIGYDTWNDELSALTEIVKRWRADESRSASLTANWSAAPPITGITCAELTKDGLDGDGEVHIGTMHRFKGLEYQRLAIVGADDGSIPRSTIERYRTGDPPRYAREHRKARSLLFVAATRARDVLRVSWHGKPSPYLPDGSRA
ncbi:3'-5' exonuclease [Nocardia sp. CNY236]|uniref:3'-5' exonuclease n=1 Tax=Nocardia sp. CNY236 TaxID=1169152 RepID=UPI0003F5CF99|nr:3'-5' exonuclease [Nocardia sp. CNY236]